MRLSLNWLKDYVNIDMSAEELSYLLTMAGLEVEELTPVGHNINSVIAAKILGIEKHPDADRLSVCRVFDGKCEVPVVCGATNMKCGDTVAMAVPGAVLPNGVKIKEGKIRGKLSCGMLLAEDELGLTSDHSGLMILSEDIEPGSELSSVMDIQDYVLDVSLTPNRPDCASVIGIAREIAAHTGQKIRLPETACSEVGPDITSLADIQITDPSGCPRYTAGIIQDVHLKPSPFIIRYRLFMSNVRAINNIVDISNYVLLETGQPLHTFDYSRLKQHRIIVKRAENNDHFITLDGQDRILNDRHLMICDGEKPVALAGIMGGLNSEISSDSRDILIESAFFDPPTIRRGSKAINLQTEASYHFERGVDIDGLDFALKRALSLAANLSDGKVAKGIIDVYPEPKSRPVIELRIEKTNVFLGTDISEEKMMSYLQALEMDVEKLEEGGRLRVVPPSWRVDIEREIDLVEEVARLEGYDNIPVTYPPVKPSEEKELPSVTLKSKTCGILNGCGFSEILNFSFISPDSVDKLGIADNYRGLKSFVLLKNPLSFDQSVMRTSLLPGMLRTVRENISRGETNLRLFEWGKIFIQEKMNNDLPVEKLSLVVAMTGLHEDKSWYNSERVVDFYDIKGALEVLFEALGIEGAFYEKIEIPPWLSKGESCSIRINDMTIGTMGRIGRNVIDAYDIKSGNIQIFELDMDAVMELSGRFSVKYEQFARFPAVYRDLSIIIDRDMESGPVIDLIRKTGGNLVESVGIFDMYRGEKLGSHKKAVSFRISYRSSKGTLEGNRVNKIHEKIIDKVRSETGGTLSEG